MARLPLDEIIQRTARDRNATAIFNNAAQVWNHDFFWRSMTPGGGGSPDDTLGRQIAADFGSLDEFARQFATQATGLFGSGWTWLVGDADGLRVVSTADADLPMIAAAACAAGVRRMGARLLSRLPERPRGVHPRLSRQAGELGICGRAVCPTGS